MKSWEKVFLRLRGYTGMKKTSADPTTLISAAATNISKGRSSHETDWPN